MLENVFSKNRSVCEIMWKNVVETDRSQMTVQHGTEKCKETVAESECVILIAFLRQQWLRERASVLRNMCVCYACDEATRFFFYCLSKP
jgi:hypothetical protein